MDYMISPRARALTVTKAADTLGVPLPAAYNEQVAQAQAFTDAAAQIGASADDLHAAVLAAIEAGRDYWTDQDVARLALDWQLSSQNIGERARARTDQLLAAALSDYADDLLAEWADALEPHTAALVAAAEANLDLNNADAAVARGGEVMHHLHNAQVAVKAWAAAEHGFHTLRSVAGIGRGGRAGELVLTPARLADLQPAYELARTERTDDLDAWLLARCGIPLRLATLGDFTERVAIFEADREAEARAEAKRRQEAGFNTR
jgi:hypothetical protein